MTTISQKLSQLSASITQTTASIDAIPKITPDPSPSGDVGTPFDLTSFTTLASSTATVIVDVNSAVTTNTNNISTLTTTVQTNHKNITTPPLLNTLSTVIAVPETGILPVDMSLLTTVVLGKLSASVTKWNFINLPTENGVVATAKLILTGDAAKTYADACSVNGADVVGGIKWVNAAAPTATAGIDVLTFTLIKDSQGVVTILGKLDANFS